MDLLQVIIPAVNRFFILFDGQVIPIVKYEKIDIDFCDRIIVRNGISEKIQYPVITYKVKMDKDSQKKLSGLFKIGTTYMETLQTKKSRIQVGGHAYKFDVDITAIPYRLKYSSDKCDIFNEIKICLKLEDTKISLFDDVEEAYEKYTRFDLLDL